MPPTKQAPAVSGVPGVNLYGFLRGQFGLAESARMYARALIDSDVPVALCDIDIELSHGRNDHSLDEWIGEEAPHSVSIIFVNPDFFAPALQKIGEERLRGRYVIACWYWELERIPVEWLSAIARVDEILVASRFVEDAFRRVTEKPILRVPLPLTEMSHSELQRVDFGLEENAFVFLCTFDFNSWVARKNPGAAIDAFRRAFPADRSDVRLLVKSSNGFQHFEKLQKLLALTEGDPRIVVRDDVMDGHHVRALQRCCDAYVSLHRAEGFGLGLAETMAEGKPTIATRWSGNLEFMDDNNSCLVDCSMVEVGKEEYPGAAGQSWAEPDIDQAARWMVRLVDEPGLALRIGSVARESVRRALAPTMAAQRIGLRLRELGASRAIDDGRHSAPINLE